MDNDITTPKQEQLTFEDLFEVAEAVVAVEILAVDYSLCAGDGPMVATARVLKVLKGPYAAEKQIRFEEGARVCGTYREGEYRILFLDKPTFSELPSTSQWRIFRQRSPMFSFFIEKDAVPALSEKTFKSFLKEIQESGHQPGKVVFR